MIYKVYDREQFLEAAGSAVAGDVIIAQETIDLQSDDLTPGGLQLRANARGCFRIGRLRHNNHSKE